MMFTELPEAPSFSPAVFEKIRSALHEKGPEAAIDTLSEELRQAEDYQALFYAMLMKERVKLGVAPFPTGPSSELPPETHEAYENAIRHAAREVGQLYLAKRNFAKAWSLYQLIGEIEPIKEAIAAYEPEDEDDSYPVVELAWQQGLMPEKGFDIILDRHGICSAITMVSSVDLSQNPDLRSYCVKRLVRSLHEQLLERLKADVQGRNRTVPDGADIFQLLEGNDDLFSDDVYHIDISHLSSVVQMAMHMPKCPELKLARELAAYGEKLSPNLRGDNDPPFENTYADYKRYLDVLDDVDREASLKHFLDKLPAAQEQGYQFPAEVVVNLLLKIDRLEEALEVAKSYLAEEDDRRLTCPGPIELAYRAKRYDVLASVSQAKSDPVNFLAGMIAGKETAKNG